MNTSIGDLFNNNNETLGKNLDSDPFNFNNEMNNSLLYSNPLFQGDKEDKEADNWLDLDNLNILAGDLNKTLAYNGPDNEELRDKQDDNILNFGKNLTTNDIEKEREKKPEEKSLEEKLVEDQNRIEMEKIKKYSDLNSFLQRVMNEERTDLLPRDKDQDRSLISKIYFWDELKSSLDLVIQVGDDHDIETFGLKQSLENSIFEKKKLIQEFHKICDSDVKKFAKSAKEAKKDKKRSIFIHGEKIKRNTEIEKKVIASNQELEGLVKTVKKQEGFYGEVKWAKSLDPDFSQKKMKILNMSKTTFKIQNLKIVFRKEKHLIRVKKMVYQVLQKDSNKTCEILNVNVSTETEPEYNKTLFQYQGKDHKDIDTLLAYVTVKFLKKNMLTNFGLKGQEQTKYEDLFSNLSIINPPNGSKKSVCKMKTGGVTVIVTEFFSSTIKEKFSKSKNPKKILNAMFQEKERSGGNIKELLKKISYKFFEMEFVIHKSMENLFLCLWDENHILTCHNPTDENHALRKFRDKFFEKIKEVFNSIIKRRERPSWLLDGMEIEKKPEERKKIVEKNCLFEKKIKEKKIQKFDKFQKIFEVDEGGGGSYEAYDFLSLSPNFEKFENCEKSKIALEILRKIQDCFKTNSEFFNTSLKEIHREMGKLRTKKAFVVSMISLGKIYMSFIYPKIRSKVTVISNFKLKKQFYFKIEITKKIGKKIESEKIAKDHEDQKVLEYYKHSFILNRLVNEDYTFKDFINVLVNAAEKVKSGQNPQRIQKFFQRPQPKIILNDHQNFTKIKKNQKIFKQPHSRKPIRKKKKISQRRILQRRKGASSSSRRKNYLESMNKINNEEIKNDDFKIQKKEKIVETPKVFQPAIKLRFDQTMIFDKKGKKDEVIKNTNNILKDLNFGERRLNDKQKFRRRSRDSSRSNVVSRKKIIEKKFQKPKVKMIKKKQIKSDFEKRELIKNGVYKFLEKKKKSGMEIQKKNSEEEEIKPPKKINKLRGVLKSSKKLNPERKKPKKISAKKILKKSEKKKPVISHKRKRSSQVREKERQENMKKAMEIEEIDLCEETQNKEKESNKVKNRFIEDKVLENTPPPLQSKIEFVQMKNYLDPNNYNNKSDLSSSLFSSDSGDDDVSLLDDIKQSVLQQKKNSNLIKRKKKSGEKFSVQKLKKKKMRTPSIQLDSEILDLTETDEKINCVMKKISASMEKSKNSRKKKSTQSLQKSLKQKNDLNEINLIQSDNESEKTVILNPIFEGQEKEKISDSSIEYLNSSDGVSLFTGENDKQNYSSQEEARRSESPSPVKRSMNHPAFSKKKDNYNLFGKFNEIEIEDDNDLSDVEFIEKRKNEVIDDGDSWVEQNSMTYSEMKKIMNKIN